MVYLGRYAVTYPPCTLIKITRKFPPCTSIPNYTIIWNVIIHTFIKIGDFRGVLETGQVLVMTAQAKDGSPKSDSPQFTRGGNYNNNMTTTTTHLQTFANVFCNGCYGTSGLHLSVYSAV